MTRLVILGSTGSIGCQTLDVVRSFPGEFELVGLCAGNNLGLLQEQVEEFRPRFYHSTAASGTFNGARLADPAEIASNPDVDLVVGATSGCAGMGPAPRRAACWKTAGACQQGTRRDGGGTAYAHGP